MDKPAGPTSHDVVLRLRRALRVKAVGHTGTLDPFASGLLVLLVGPATRVARFLDGLPKTYLGVARLGIRTDTDDRTGKVLGEPVDVGSVSPEMVRADSESFPEIAGKRPDVGTGADLDPERDPAGCQAEKFRRMHRYRHLGQRHHLTPPGPAIAPHAVHQFGRIRRWTLDAAADHGPEGREILALTPR